MNKEGAPVDPKASWAAIEAIMEQWNAEYGIRTERLEHTHIFQIEGGLPGCLACEVINPLHMTIGYVDKARFMRSGGWA